MGWAILAFILLMLIVEFSPSPDDKKEKGIMPITFGVFFAAGFLDSLMKNNKGGRRKR